MSRPRLASLSFLGLLVAGVGLVLVLLGTGARGATPAPAPSTIARGLPGGAVAYLELPDAAGLMSAWRRSDAHAAFAGSPADRAMRQGMLWLRLGERVAALEALAGVSLDWERAELLFGKEAGVAVYDLAETRFVLVARVRASKLVDTPLAAATRKLAKRQHGGVSYYVHEAPAGGAGASLAFALLGDRVVLGNDLPRFREALLLTARQAGVKLDAAAKLAPSLADDAAFKALLARSPAAADARVFVRLSALRGTHHFDDFWIFHWAAGRPSPRVDGVDATVLSLRLDAGGARETRVHAVTDPGRLAHLPEATQAPACAAALPAGLVVVAGAGAPGPALLRLVPERGAGGFWNDADRAAHDDARAGAASDLSSVVQKAGGDRHLDVAGLTPEARADGAAHLRRTGAVAFRLGQPGRFDRAAAEAALLAALRAAVGARVPLAFADAPGGLRVLELPLVGAAEWRLTLRAPRAGEPFLVVATDEAAAGELVRALGQPATAALVAPGAPECSRVDFRAASAAWKVFAGATGAAPQTEAVREFVQEIAPALFATAHLTTVSNVVYRTHGLLVEETEYLW